MDQREHALPERVRAQVLAREIPAAKHGPDALAAMFPREFNISATGLSAEDVALRATKVAAVCTYRADVAADEFSP